MGIRKAIQESYIYARRMTNHTSWYYPWDCASGCIWDPAAIAAIEVVPALAAAVDGAP